MLIWRDRPLAGRRQQLAEIETARQRGTAGGVLITGPMGVGKTRLAREMIVRADAEGCVTHWVAATQAAREIPFAAFAHLLPDDEDTCRTLLGRLQIASRVLRRRARGRSVVIGVDDIHLLDNASAALVHHLIVSGTAFVIATARSVEHVPDVFTALWRQGAAQWLELEPLTEDATAELLSSLLGDQVDGRARRRLYQMSQGNALYLRQLHLRAAEGRGRVAAVRQALPHSHAGAFALGSDRTGRHRRTRRGRGGGLIRATGCPAAVTSLPGCAPGDSRSCRAHPGARRRPEERRSARSPVVRRGAPRRLAAAAVDRHSSPTGRGSRRQWRPPPGGSAPAGDVAARGRAADEFAATARRFP